MKIAFLNIGQNAVERGAETFVLELSTRLKKEHDVKIFSTSIKPPARWRLLWRFFVDFHGLTILFFTIKCLPALIKGKFDVIFAVNGGWQSVLVRLVCWLTGAKMVISGQSGKGWDDRFNLWCFPDLFVALSTSLCQWAKKVNPWVRVEYIANGVDLAKFSSQGPRMEFGVAKPVVLCVGALTEEKRIHLAVAAMTKVAQGSLVVVGEGILARQLQNLGQKLLPGRFLLIRASFEQMPDIYRAGDVLTLPSPSFRSFEIVLVEAMATGLPVVANDDPIRREIVDDAGVLVDPSDVDSYAGALTQALQTNWGDRPRKQAEKFSWESIGQKYLRILPNL